MKDFLIDTNVAIMLIRKNEEVIELLQRTEYTFKISFVTIAELFLGVKTKKHKALVENLIELFTIDYGSQYINELSNKLLKENYLNKGIDFEDSIIAATALINDYILITENTKDFKFIDELEIYNIREANSRLG